VGIDLAGPLARAPERLRRALDETVGLEPHAFRKVECTAVVVGDELGDVVVARS
jgi:hypothetical protein